MEALAGPGLGWPWLPGPGPVIDSTTRGATATGQDSQDRSLGDAYVHSFCGLSDHACLHLPGPRWVWMLSSGRLYIDTEPHPFPRRLGPVDRHPHASSPSLRHSSDGFPSFPRFDGCPGPGCRREDHPPCPGHPYRPARQLDLRRLLHVSFARGPSTGLLRSNTADHWPQ